MASNWGNYFHISIFGESHGVGIGVVIDGVPAGLRLDLDKVTAFMQRRAPGQSKSTTPRRERDSAEILSGFYAGVTTGTPLCAVIRNTDTHSADYAQFSAAARPGHADYTGFVRYGGHNDVRGGGHFSARLTAPLCFAGAVALQLLEQQGIFVGAHLLRAGGVADTPFDPMMTDIALLQSAGQRSFPVLDEAAGEQMQAAIERARMALDSVGGIVECAVLGLPVGMGSPMFGGLENRLASIIFGIPAVKGVEFGEGFAAAELTGSQNNDGFAVQDGRIVTTTNRAGGILGGISSGMPLLLRAAFKPTPSISQQQHTVDFRARKEQELVVTGRHDPCVAVRAVPVVEAATAIAIADALLEMNGYAKR